MAHVDLRRPALALAMAASVGLGLACSGGPAAEAARPAARTDGGTSAGTSVGGCPVFPRNNYWNASIADLPVSSHSDAWLSHMSPESLLHPDFGPSYGEQPVPYGIPITLVGGDHAKVDVVFRYDDESDHVPYPLGSDTRIEGGRRSHGDRHALVLDTST